MMRLLISLCASLFLIPFCAFAQEGVSFDDHSISVADLKDASLATFLAPHLDNTQFIMIGEQHFIQEAAGFTKAIYELAQAEGYHRLCIENDALAAQKITALAGADDPVAAARKFQEQYPTTLAFYENEEDYDLLSHVVKSGGELWGIDQTLMSQFRYNFSYLVEHAKNQELVEYARTLLDKATQAYENAIANKAFQAIYYFQYDEATQERLQALASSEEEKEIIRQLNLTKEIYGYNFAQQYYLNNQARGMLMKRNFMRHYNAALTPEDLPKVVFKLGAYHTFRGLTPTNIYDISNLVSELAIMNGRRSLHLWVRGISGKQSVIFPFAPEPIISFDNTAEFPTEIQEWLASTDLQKYTILDLTVMRPTAKQYSKEMRDLIFSHDLLVLVKDAQALTAF